MSNDVRNRDERTEPTVLQRDALAIETTVTRRSLRLRWSEASGPREAVIDARTTLGSGEKVDTRVDDAAVSRVHLDIEVREDGAWVRDLESLNGTYVDGVRVALARIPDNSSLRIGATSIRASYDASPKPVEVWPDGHFGPLIGRAPAMREFFSRLHRVAKTDSTTLIVGETGTGKELVARAVHDASSRANGPFVVIDCASLPESLLEAELFGHSKGAFTGAAVAREGAIASADGGTVFIDEIGELPLSMQPKLLRVLESRTVRRVGESAQRSVDVRFVAATHRDLGTMVNTGGFREDLYFRLAVLPLRVPSLRARREDIPLLVQHFLPPGVGAAIDPDTLRSLVDRPWLGNVRELRNFVERAVVLGAADALGMHDDAGTPIARSDADATGLPEPPIDEPFKSVRDRWLSHLEREYLRAMLHKHERNVANAARAAGLDKSYVHRLIHKYGL